MRTSRYSEPSDAELDALHTPLCGCGSPVEHFGDTCDSCLESLTLDLEETSMSLESQQKPSPFAVNDDKDPLQLWREAYTLPLGNKS